MKTCACIFAMSLLGLAGASAAADPHQGHAPEWRVDFRDDFESFDPANWQDQILWVNDEDQCYVRDGQYGTREVSGGTLKLRVVDLGRALPCDNVSKEGNQHPDTRYVAGRIASKNRREFRGGRWTARLRTRENGQDGMFPAWWLLGARNNEPPVQEPDENICWPMTGSGEVDIFEHHGSGGPGRYASRMIRSLGYCGGGDWETPQKIVNTDLDEFHEYSVEWQGADLVFRLDGVETHRIPGGGDDLPEPMFAILNFAKHSAAPMEGEWVLEVDWVQHEYRQ
jgi:beta-glucanase (GH16 family)